MSLIGNKVISVPEKVTINFNEGSSEVEVSGPRGVMKSCFEGINIEVKDNNLYVSIKDDVEKSDVSRLHGLYHVLVENMIIGVSTGFKKTLELTGKGYKGTLLTKNIIEFDLGFSHKVIFCLPKEISCEISGDKAKVILVISGNDKCLVGQVSAKIKSLRPVEPYKGKGFRYSGQFVKTKISKKTKK